jgi:hypothetical protein
MLSQRPQCSKDQSHLQCPKIVVRGQQSEKVKKVFVVEEKMLSVRNGLWMVCSAGSTLTLRLGRSYPDVMVRDRRFLDHFLSGLSMDSIRVFVKIVRTSSKFVQVGG